MRLFTSTLATTIAVGLLAGCSGNMATTPSAAVAPSLSGQSKIESRTESVLPQLSKHGFPLPQGNIPVTIQTSNGNFVTAVYRGGGPNEPNCGSAMVALHENARTIGSWETFTVVYVQSTGKYAFKTVNGNYITAVLGGGLGGPNYGVPYSQLHTDATKAGPWEQFTLIPINPSQGQYAIQTGDGGHYVTAANGGGCGGANTVPFHTDATSIGSWEQFTLNF